MARMIFIGLLVFFALACIGIGFGMYFWMKRTMVGGEPLMNRPVNEQTRTDKMGAGELLVYGSIIAVAALLAVLIMQEQGGGSAILAKAILLPPVGCIVFDDGESPHRSASKTSCADYQ